MVSRPRVVAIEGLLEGIVCELHAGTPATFGRAAHNTVPVPDARVSRTHCRFECRGADVFVTDLGTSNGTRVNGQPITERQLVSGDTIELGSALFRFEAAGSSGSAADAGAAGPLPIDSDLPAAAIRKRFDTPASSLRGSAASASVAARAQERLAAVCGMAGVINSNLPDRKSVV